jgi:hypothetical protein
VGAEGANRGCRRRRRIRDGGCAGQPGERGGGRLPPVAGLGTVGAPGAGTELGAPPSPALAAPTTAAPPQRPESLWNMRNSVGRARPPPAAAAWRRSPAARLAPRAWAASVAEIGEGGRAVSLDARGRRRARRTAREAQAARSPGRRARRARPRRSSAIRAPSG